MKNQLIVKILNNIADILELQSVEFKPTAYRRAALSIDGLTEDIEAIADRGELEEIPGVGKHIAEKIEEIIKTGRLKYYEDLKREIDIDVEALNEIPFLGPKKIQQLYHELNIRNIPDLEKAIRNHKLRQLRGFGEETEKKLLQGIEFYKTKPKRFLYIQAIPVVKMIHGRMGQLSFVQQLEVAGSFRRGKETVGDLDFLAVSSKPEKVMDVFTALPGTTEILAKGTTKSSIRLENGLQVDLRVVRPKEFGSAMNYFIGSKEHNVELRKFALSKGCTLSEYGLFKVQGKKWVAGRTEQEIYAKLRMQYIEPELRENTGEIQAALQKKLPLLITVKDVKGVFHNHSTWSDGNDSLPAMARKAEELKLKFISFNDHFGHIGITNPLTKKRLGAYLKELDKVRKKVGVRVFSGVEIDILKDGTLPLPPAKLKELDVVIASVHTALQMDRQSMTQRVCSALENYPVNIVGHPTDRLLMVREPLQLDLDTVFESAQANSVFLEMNASPQRMDLDGLKVKAGKQAGCQFALSTDAHAVNHLEHWPLGVLLARRGWLEKKDVLNCWSLPKIENALGK